MNVKKIVSEMTLEEKAGLCSGEGSWHTKVVKRLGVPDVMVLIANLLVEILYGFIDPRVKANQQD